VPDHPQRVDVAYALILDEQEGRILVVRNENGAWSLPGGMREPGETLREAAVRETREETGLDVTAGPVVHISERMWETHDLFVTFRAHMTTPGTPAKGDPDIQEVAWVGVEAAQRLMPYYENLSAVLDKSTAYQSRRGE
jgi:8-oxo-dGTP diphosphatase